MAGGRARQASQDAHRATRGCVDDGHEQSYRHGGRYQDGGVSMVALAANILWYKRSPLLPHQQLDMTMASEADF